MSMRWLCKVNGVGDWLLLLKGSDNGRLTLYRKLLCRKDVLLIDLQALELVALIRRSLNLNLCTTL